jgi:hypothetical protein
MAWMLSDIEVEADREVPSGVVAGIVNRPKFSCVEGSL